MGPSLAIVASGLGLTVILPFLSVLGNAAGARRDVARLRRFARIARRRDEHPRDQGRACRGQAVDVGLPCPVQHRRLRRLDADDLPAVRAACTFAEHAVLRGDHARGDAARVAAPARRGAGRDRAAGRNATRHRAADRRSRRRRLPGGRRGSRVERAADHRRWVGVRNKGRSRLHAVRHCHDRRAPHRRCGDRPHRRSRHPVLGRRRGSRWSSSSC